LVLKHIVEQSDKGDFFSKLFPFLVPGLNALSCKIFPMVLAILDFGEEIVDFITCSLDAFVIVYDRFLFFVLQLEVAIDEANVVAPGGGQDGDDSGSSLFLLLGLLAAFRSGILHVGLGEAFEKVDVVSARIACGSI
jgi:hypothetical protein